MKVKVEEKRIKIKHLETMKELNAVRMQVYDQGLNIKEPKDVLSHEMVADHQSSHPARGPQSSVPLVPQPTATAVNPSTSALRDKAYRDKLQAWLRIGAKESAELREFVAFLRSCEVAMVHIKHWRF